MADSTAMTRHEHKATFRVGDVPKDAAWHDTTRRVFFDEYHIELTPQESACDGRQHAGTARSGRGIWRLERSSASSARLRRSAARAHPRGAADELLGAKAPQKRIYQRGWCNLLG